MCDGILDLSIEKTGQAYVLIGAGSAMGPLTKLLKHGATVVCIDIPGAWGAGPQAMWKRIFDQAANSPGNVIYPYNGAGGNAASALPDEKTYADKMKQVGFNLTEQPKEVLVWLNAVRKDLGVPLVVGNYTYLDSDMHVKLSIAADAVIKGLCEADNKTKIAFLCTPTDIHVITDAAHKEAGKNYGWHAGMSMSMSKLKGIGPSIGPSLCLSLTSKWLYFNTCGVLFHVECCIRLTALVLFYHTL